MHVLLQQMQIFRQTSGLNVNVGKCSIYFGGVKENLKQVILQDTGFKQGSFPFRYLGIPLSPHRLLTSQFAPLFHKMEGIIQGWIGKHLSYAGQLELIQSVLYGMVQFWLSIFPMSRAVLQQITSLCRNFLWTSDILRSKSALMAWKFVCLPKKKGGLGLPDLKARNSSFIAKQLWSIHLQTDSIWIWWIHHFYLQTHTIWDTPTKKTSSPLWKSIINLKNQLLEDCGGHLVVIALM